MDKKKDKKSKTVSEFRQIKQTAEKFENHPIYTYKKIGDDFIVLVITHDKKKSNRSKVKKLDKNPSPNDSSIAKIHKKARIIDKKLCGQRKSDWKFKTKKDIETVKTIIANNKGKKLERIDKKK